MARLKYPSLPAPWVIFGDISSTPDRDAINRMIERDSVVYDTGWIANRRSGEKQSFSCLYDGTASFSRPEALPLRVRTSVGRYCKRIKPRGRKRRR